MRFFNPPNPHTDTSAPPQRTHTHTYACTHTHTHTHLADADGVVQHRLGVGAVVAAGQGGVAEVGLQQQVGLGVGAVVRVGVDRQGELLSQLAVELVLVVAHGQLGVLLRVLVVRWDGWTGEEARR